MLHDYRTICRQSKSASRGWGQVDWNLPISVANASSEAIVVSSYPAPANHRDEAMAKAAIKSSKSTKTPAVKQMSAKARVAAKAFKGLKVKKTPDKLKGAKADAIKRAVRGYYLTRV